jgi:hypothetical protein
MSAELVQKAIPCLSIQGVYLREAHFNQEDDFDASTLPQGAELKAQYRAAAKSMRLVEVLDVSGVEHRLMNVLFTCGIRLISPDKIKNDDLATGVVAEISATFIAQYQILPNTNPSQEELDAFAKSNAGYHIWPFWREYAQSTCTRSGLPVITIPMYRVPKENQAKRPEKARKPGATKKKAKVVGKS